MRRRVPASGLLFSLAALAILLATPLFAQQIPARPSTTPQPSTTISISTGTADVNDVVRRGLKLEVERRWGEALSHYEDAMRLFPGDGRLQRRFDFARLHYDVERRYADRSFCDSLAKLPPGEALDVYAQVLLKIQAHYVEAPNWKELVERGTNNLEVALSEPAFVERNLPERDWSAVDEFRRELRRVLGPQVIDSRSNARNAVATAAALAQRQLEILPTAVVLEYVCGATNTLDPYSAYLTPSQLAEVYSQIEGNLGQRMAASFARAFAQGATSVVLTGSDIPGLDHKLVRTAFQKLETAPIVLGPAADGGYYLIGMRAPNASLLEGIVWSTDRPLAQTKALAHAQGLEVVCLSQLYDIDTLTEYRRWRAARIPNEKHQARD